MAGGLIRDRPVAAPQAGRQGPHALIRPGVAAQSGRFGRRLADNLGSGLHQPADLLQHLRALIASPAGSASTR